jgi:hypothetical protein
MYTLTLADNGDMNDEDTIISGYNHASDRTLMLAVTVHILPRS